MDMAGHGRSSSQQALGPVSGNAEEMQAVPMMRAEQPLEPASAMEMQQVLKKDQRVVHGEAAHNGASQGQSQVSIQMMESGAMRMAAKESKPGHHLPMQIKEFPGSLALDQQVFKPAPAIERLFKQDSKGQSQAKGKGTKSSAQKARKGTKSSAQKKIAGSHGTVKAGSTHKTKTGQPNSGLEDDDLQRAEDLGYEMKESAEEKEDDAAEDDWDDDDTKVTVKEQHIDPDPDTDAGYSKGDADETGSADDGYDQDDSAYDAETMPMVNVTAEEDATPAPNTGPLKAKDPNPGVAPPPENEVEKLGEGIGAMAYERSPTGSRVINHDLRQRLQLQDFATIGLLLTVFALTIGLSCCSVYQVSDDTSPAAYYSEPKHYQQRVICESRDVDAFLAAFNTQPQNVRLRIIGRNPEPGGFRRFLRNLNAHATRPRGLAALLPMRQRRRLSVLFDVALDLTPFITGDGRLSDENLMILQKHLNTANRLESLVIEKKVDWALWEDVATNIRQRLRTLGFPGDVEVRFEAQDEVMVYQNHKWSNFVRNRVTQALVVISIIGSAIWVPYVMVRSKVTKIETRFNINVDPSRYWELVSDGLSAAEGFQGM
jgi:hypothetical protein